MTRDLPDRSLPTDYPNAPLYGFEIYVGRGFCEFETSAITKTLSTANAILGEARFKWRYVSETPGLQSGNCGLIVRAEPLVKDHELADALIVVGGKSGRQGDWFARLRQMRRLSRPIALLSDAATTYIKQTRDPVGKITTHWRDALALIETANHPKLTNTLLEKSGGIMTAAGSGATTELVITLIGSQLELSDVVELGNRLMLPHIRSSNAEQPKDILALPALSDKRVKAAVQAMEQTLDTPLNIYELAKTIGVSTRHLERMFKDVFAQTPARFYKQLRVRRARALIEETQLPMMEIAIATGFGSSSSMNEAIKTAYGQTASKMRSRH